MDVLDDGGEIKFERTQKKCKIGDKI